MNKIIVSRHPAMKEYLMHVGMVDEFTPSYTHVERSDVEGKHVFGMIPVWLAAHADRLTEIPVITPPSVRGAELTLEHLMKYARAPQTYRIFRVGWGL